MNRPGSSVTERNHKVGHVKIDQLQESNTSTVVLRFPPIKTVEARRDLQGAKCAFDDRFRNRPVIKCGGCEQLCSTLLRNFEGIENQQSQSIRIFGRETWIEVGSHTLNYWTSLVQNLSAVKSRIMSCRRMSRVWEQRLLCCLTASYFVLVDDTVCNLRDFFSSLLDRSLTGRPNGERVICAPHAFSAKIHFHSCSDVAFQV